MSLQFLTNINPPPTQSALEYDVEPGVVFLSTDDEQLFVNLTITVTNTTNAPVNCMEFQLGFLAGAATGNLTTALAAGEITAASDQTDWSITNSGSFSGSDNPNLYLFTATPSGVNAYLPLAPGASLVFHLNEILVDQSVGEGTAPFNIIEQTGTTKSNRQTVTGSVALTKEPSTLSIGSFDVLPPTPVSPGTEISLSWEVTGAIYWQLYNTTLTKLLYDSGHDSQPKMSWQDAPLEWTEYELIAYAGQIFTTAFAVAQVTNPRFVDPLPSASPDTVDSAAAATISWSTVHADYVIVTAEGFTSPRIDSSSGQGSCQVNPISATLYTLTAYSDSDESGDIKHVQVDVNPPQIISFTTSSTSFTPGQSINLSWETESVTSATLDPGAFSVPVNGSNYPVYPVGKVVYQLTGQQGPAGQGATAKSEPVTVTQMLETFSAGGAPGALAYDGTYIWVESGSSNTLTRLLATDGSQQGTFQVKSSDYAITPGGAYIWIANTLDGSTGNPIPGNTVTRLLAADGSDQGDIQVMEMPSSLLYDGVYIWASGDLSSLIMRLLAADGSYQGTYDFGFTGALGAFDGTYIWLMGSVNISPVVNTLTRLLASDGSNHGTFTVGQNPIALVYDGMYIWAANYLDNSVTRLLAIDGSNHGTFPVGRNPAALAHDGRCIWVANLYDNTVTRLLAIDGSLQGTFDIGSPNDLIYDGTYIWVANGVTVARIRPSDWPLSKS